MSQRLHQVPTHIDTPEPILSVGALSLSARQFLLLLLGSALSYHCWQQLAWLSSPAALLVRGTLSALPVLCALAVALVRLADRPLERWVLVLARFGSRPRLLLWRSLRHEPEHLAHVIDEEQTRA